MTVKTQIDASGDRDAATRRAGAPPDRDPPAAGAPAGRRPRLTSRDRSAILASLGAGVVPHVGLAHIQVGRAPEVRAIVADLKRIEEGGASIRFVVGPFGAGKSFFLTLLRTVALERRLVVAHADITTGRRLHATDGKARALWAELARNVSTRGRPSGGALPHLIERWVDQVAEEVRAAGGTDADVAGRLGELCRPLQEFVGGFDFTKVVTAYWRGHLAGDAELQDRAIRWLRGEYTNKTEARRDLDVRTIIDDANLYDSLKLLAAFCRIAGHRGLLVCFDELVVLSHRLNNRVSRDNNYEAILRIVNDCLQGGVEGLGVVFGATDDCVFDERRGLFSYEALATRLAGNRFAGSEGVVDLAGPVMRLKPLTPEECYVLLVNVRRVFAGGDDAKAAALLPDKGLTAYMQSCQNRMGAAFFHTPRDTVKDFVGLLQVLEQNPGTRWTDVLAMITTSESDVQVRDPNEVPEAGPGNGDDLATFRL